MKKNIEKMPGHWLLAQMGKKVLRPGGKELTLALINELGITRNDDVVEFAPGLGFTAKLTLKHNPKSYTAIELDQKAVNKLKNIIQGSGRYIVQGNAADSSLDDACADKVYGEAMLTMHADHRKAEIIREGHRLLRPGGYYGIHELGLTSILKHNHKKTIRQDLARAIRVNARPLTEVEWKELLEQQGFKIVKSVTNPMHLLKFRRMVDDEGFLQTLKIVFRIATHPNVRKRILEMRRVFEKHQHHMNAIALIAQKQ